MDVDCDSIVESVSTQKEFFSYVDEYLYNLQYDWFGGSDDTFEILYKDGSRDYINEEYDGHKIRRNNIISMVYNNACTAIVYGGFSINEYGVVTTSETVNIAKCNLKEITNE